MSSARAPSAVVIGGRPRWRAASSPGRGTGRRRGRPHAVGGLGHQRGVGRDDHRQHDGALRAELLGELGAGLDRRAGRPRRRPGRASCDWRRRTCHAPRRRRRARASRSSSSPMRAAMAPSRPSPGRLHLAAAFAHEADAVLEREHAGRDERRVLAHRVTGGEGGDGARGPRRRPSARASRRGSRSRSRGGPAARSR